MPRYGVIDLGSNTIRLVVYEVKDHAKPPYGKNDFKAIVNEKKAAGLSAYVKDGELTNDGLEKATDVLQDHVESARGVGCKKIEIFATAVIRNAKNGKKIAHLLEHSTKCKLRILTGEEEAHLGFVGAACDHEMKKGVLIDIGGGSTEVTRIHKEKDARNISLDQGSVSSYAQFVNMVFPTTEEISGIEQAFEDRMRKSGLLCSNLETSKEMFGIGGSVRAIAKFNGRIHGSDKAAKILTFADVEEVLQVLENDPSLFAHTAVKAVPDRLHTLVPGAVITRCLMKSFQSKTLSVGKFGVREGYLIEHMLED